MDSGWAKGVVISLLMCCAQNSVAATIGDCSAIKDQSDRLNCYDELAGRVEEKMAEVEAKPTSTQERQMIRQEAVSVVIGEKPAVDALRIKQVFRNRLNRITYIAEDGRRFKNQASTGVSFREGDEVRLEEGFLGAKILVRTDGLQAKVKEISPES